MIDAPPSLFTNASPGIVADNGDDEVHFHTAYTPDLSASSVSSLFDVANGNGRDPFDFTPYMDQVRIYFGPYGAIESNVTKNRLL